LQKFSILTKLSSDVDFTGTFVVFGAHIMRNSLLTMLLFLAVIAGTTSVAKADSQSFNVYGSNGRKTLAVNTTGFWVLNYTLTLNGGSGSYAGVNTWFTPGKLFTAQFTDVFKGVAYREIFTAQWTGFGWSFGKNYDSVQASEESSFFELLAVALALILVLPLATKLRRPVRA
jgi:hypothetical protein